MPTIFDYLKANQYDSFYDKEFTVLDALALTELAYLPFEDLVPAEISVQNYISLQHLAEQFEEKFQGKYPPLGMVNAHRLKLLSYLSSFKRYKHIRALGFANDVSLDSQKQFAAITYQIRPKEYLVVFRGTDDSIIGWKEDFHLTYMKEIPAQLAARDYLKEVLDKLDGKVWLAGHSKGGNLAIYAAMNADPKVRKRIQHVYSLDGPGFPPEIVTSPAYRTIQPKVTKIVPSSSIVGMIFETPEPCRVVSSDSDGIMQHSAFTWLLDGDQFITEPDLSSSSQLFNEELNHWIATLTPEQRERAVDALFTVLHANGATSFSEVMSNFPASIPAMLGAYVGLTPADRRHLVEALAILFKASTAKRKPTPAPASAPSSATSKATAEIPAETAAGADSAAPARADTDADAGTTASPSAEDATEIAD